MALAPETLQEGWVPDPSRDFGQRLALVRQHHAWNVAEAARECGLDPASWTAWETEGRMPRMLVDVCEKIANRSRCQFYWLLTGNELPQQRTGTDSREGGPQVTHEKVAVRRVGNVLYPTFGGRRVVEHEHLAPVIHLADRRLAVAA